MLWQKNKSCLPIPCFGILYNSFSSLFENNAYLSANER